MYHPGKNLRMFIASLGAITALASLWSFYQFVQFRDSEKLLDPRGETLYLLLAVAAATIACAAIAFLFFSAAGRGKKDVKQLAYHEQAHK